MKFLPGDERERPLDPVGRISGILFGLIMAVKIVGTVSSATSGPDDMRTVTLAELVIFLMVVIATFPMVVPFVLTSDSARAIRLSRVVTLEQAVERFQSHSRGAGEPHPR